MAPSTTLAAYPGANGRIAYSLDSLNASGIYTALPDGSDAKRLTDHADYSPSWSASGRRIVFVRYDGHDYEIFEMRADGSDQRQLTDDGDDEHSPYLSPHGRRVAFTRSRAGTTRGLSLYTMRVDGSELRLLLEGFITDPQYSPDGRHLVFSLGSNRPCCQHIWRTRGNGSHLKRLSKARLPGSSHRGGIDFQPDYSPDGRQIAFEHCLADVRGCGYQIFVMRADGDSPRPLPSAYFTAPAWAPDGTRLAVEQLVYEGEFPAWTNLYTIAADGSDKQPIVDNTNDYAAYATSPSWQPIARP
jgi:Tol biopolymer transport system component